jgi:acetyl-CoA carboxylase biotin carboxyl carrier protein
VTSADEGDALLTSAGVASSDVSALLTLLAPTDVVELDISVGTTHLSIRRGAAPHTSVRSTSSSDARSDGPTLAVTSPLVGVFHPSVAVGATLEAGQPIGAVEAMGMPTNVDAPQAGTVEDLLVPDGSPVEYGQPLVVLRRLHAILP